MRMAIPSADGLREGEGRLKTASIDEHRRLLAEALARADSDIGELRARMAEGERAGERVAAELAVAQSQLAESRAECTQLRSISPGSWARCPGEQPRRSASQRRGYVRCGAVGNRPARGDRARIRRGRPVAEPLPDRRADLRRRPFVSGGPPRCRVLRLGRRTRERDRAGLFRGGALGPARGLALGRAPALPRGAGRQRQARATAMAVLGLTDRVQVERFDLEEADLSVVRQLRRRVLRRSALSPYAAPGSCCGSSASASACSSSTRMSARRTTSCSQVIAAASTASRASTTRSAACRTSRSGQLQRRSTECSRRPASRSYAGGSGRNGRTARASICCAKPHSRRHQRRNAHAQALGAERAGRARRVARDRDQASGADDDARARLRAAGCAARAVRRRRLPR